MKNIRTKSIAAVATSAAAVLGTMGVASSASGLGWSSVRSSGPDYVYGEANPFASSTAVVHVVKVAGKTRVALRVHGADAPAGQVFGAHVHQSPCGASGIDAGGHYQQPDVEGSIEDKEVWLDFAVNAAGNGLSRATRPWLLDETTPRSVIIHAMPTAPDTGAAGDRLVCIDLDGN